jgi:hypothetical protein
LNRKKFRNCCSGLFRLVKGVSLHIFLNARRSCTIISGGKNRELALFLFILPAIG